MTTKYNFEQLGWFNFEQLIRTLFRELLGSGLSTFSGSADQSRDATFSGKANRYPSAGGPWKGNWIIQVKHRTYSSRGADKVRNELRDTLIDEVESIVNKYDHPCDNYIFVTNCPLTATDKDEMQKVVTKRLLGRKISIIGESDLQELLDGNPKVVSAFPQLLGVSQLKELVQWGLHQRSVEFLAAAQADIATFVATTPYLTAIELLHRQDFCVLSGPPKMGKTCTAYAVAASFAALRYEIYDLRGQRDFYDAYRSDSKQLFICDDVFGDIALHASLRDEWTRGFERLLASLDRDHKLIWTAREYILVEAVATSRLKEERPHIESTDKVTVAVDRLTRLEKAMILYNHAKSASLPDEVREFLKGKSCLAIVDHENYSPESVRQLCTGRLVEFSKEAHESPNSVLELVAEFMAEPGDAWKSAYLAAPEGERVLCTEVMASGGTIQLKELRRRYDEFMSTSSIRLPAFDMSFKNAQGTFLRKNSAPIGYEFVQFYHPSMRDLLVELIETDKSIRVAYLKQLKLAEMSSLAKSNKTTIRDSSARHRIMIDDKDDISLVEDLLNGHLLPKSSLVDIISLISDLRFTLEEESAERRVSRAKESDSYPAVFWKIIDCVMPHVCSREFWITNAEVNQLAYWRRLFDGMRVLLPLATSTPIPQFVPELLRRHKNITSVDYWGVVQAAASIVPTIVEQCVDFDDRNVCREKIVELINSAIDASESVDLDGDVEDSQSWHSENDWLTEEAEDFEILFPDDEPISEAATLNGIIEAHPRLEYESDDGDWRDYGGRTSYDDSAIIGLFSDL